MDLPSLFKFLLIAGIFKIKKKICIYLLVLSFLGENVCELGDDGNLVFKRTTDCVSYLGH